MSRAGLAMLITLVVAAPATAQPSLSASMGPGVTSTGSAATGQFNASATVEHLMKEERVRLFYGLERGDYATEGDWRFLEHSAGGSYKFGFGEKKAHGLYLGMDGTLRRNGDAWAAANFNGASAFANLELHPGRATVRTGYRLDARSFPSSAALDQVQHSIFGSVLASFETRTTLIAEVSAGTKHYAAVSSRTEVIAVPADPSIQARGAGGRGRGVPGATLVPVLIEGAPGSDARHVTLFGRIAQSLAARTGLSVEVSRRRVSGEVSPALIATPASFLDDGIYDDLFASNATRAAVNLKSIVGSGIELAASAAWLDKDYPATFAFDEDGIAMPGMLRADRATMAGLDASWPLFPSRTGAASLKLLTGYDYTRNRSTSALYRYSAHAVRFAFGVTY